MVQLRTQRTALALYAVLLVLPTLVLGFLQSLNYMPIIAKTDANFDAYVELFDSRVFWESLRLSLYVAFVSTALSIVREKENGTMEQIRMAPISTPAFVIGKAASFLVLSHISGVLVILAAMALFGLPMRGSWLALNVVLLVFLVGAVGTGLLVSAMAETRPIP